jgi:hypothetical protein
MRSAAEVLTYIDNLINFALERPAMYASSPAALEEVLFRLDEVRDFILSDATKAGLPKSSYTRFLLETGHGVSRFCSSFTGDADSTDTEIQRFQKLATFWKQYLEARSK